MKVLVLHSGGQDSTTCLMDALANDLISEVLCVAFDYSQRHGQEITYAHLAIEQLRKVTDKKIETRTVYMPNLLGNSALIMTDDQKDINAAHESDKSLPASFVPGRNLLFLTISGAMCVAEDISKIVAGFCETDFSGYPDCRNDTISAMQTALNLGLFADRPQHKDKIDIHCPLMHKTKAETWRLAKVSGEKLGFDGVEFIRQYTLTDYNGNLTLNDWGRGAEDNPASVLRAKGYREAVQQGMI